MGKLLKLLNEYRPNSWMEYMWWIAYIWADQYSYPVDCEVLTIISKEYGFIKWLVDNDKIDKEKIIREETIPLKDINEDYMLMMLAIQDKPVDVLISVLK